MRLLDRNKKPFYYALYSSDEMMTDANGDYTGERETAYETRVKAYGYIKPFQGEYYRGGATVMNVGVVEDYDATLILSGIDWPVTETTVFWIDDFDGGPEYRVVKIAKALNHTTVRLRKVR